MLDPFVLEVLIPRLVLFYVGTFALAALVWLYADWKGRRRRRAWERELTQARAIAEAEHRRAQDRLRCDRMSEDALWGQVALVVEEMERLRYAEAVQRYRTPRKPSGGRHV